MLSSLEQFRKLHEERREGYLQASLTIQTGSRSVESVVTEIMETLGLKEIALRTEQGEVE